MSLKSFKQETGPPDDILDVHASVCSMVKGPKVEGGRPFGKFGSY